MWQALVSSAGRLLDDFNRSMSRRRVPSTASRRTSAPLSYHRLARVILADQVARTLFDEYAAHRRGNRREEETGWILLGLREENEVVVLATLPAGAESNAGVAHVHFNSNAQALGSRVVRQTDRRLTIVGVVHTHPGSMRHPSDGDYRGDSEWVARLRGGDGVFGIGTVDAAAPVEALYARQPRPHVQCLDDLSFCWYALAAGDVDYRPLPYRLTLGPDLARPLHAVWPEIEAHAEALDRLFRQQTGITFAVVNGTHRPALAVRVPLAEPGDGIRVIMEGKEVSYYVLRGGQTLAADLPESRIDRGVYLALAELALD